MPGNICGLSARHCGPHSSSIKQSILNWHDRLLKGRISKVMWRTRKGSGAHTIKLTVIRARTAISSSRSQQISIIRKDGARTIIVLAIRITNVFIKESVNLRTALLLMVKTVELNIISLLTVPLLAGMQSFAVNVKEKIITMRKLPRVVFPTSWHWVLDCDVSSPLISRS